MRASLGSIIAGLVLVAGAAAGCSSGGDTPGAASRLDPPSVTVQPDLEAESFTAQVVITDDGFEPEVLRLPAGRRVQLIIRNHGSTEHHYRVEGLIPAQLRWRLEPEVNFYDIDNMGYEDLIEYGIDAETLAGEGDLDHVLHHLTPTFVPYKEASPSGVKPLGTEVHGYVTLGVQDVLTFIPLNTGRFDVEDVLHPEITGSVVVFLPDDARVVE